MAKINLSIYLIKDNITEFSDIVEEDAIELHQYDDNSIVTAQILKNQIGFSISLIFIAKT